MTTHLGECSTDFHLQVECLTRLPCTLPKQVRVGLARLMVSLLASWPSLSIVLENKVVTFLFNLFNFLTKNEFIIYYY